MALLTQNIEAIISSTAVNLASGALHVRRQHSHGVVKTVTCDGLRRLALLYLVKAADNGLWPLPLRDHKLCGLLESIMSFEVPDTCIEQNCSQCRADYAEVMFREKIGNLKVLESWSMTERRRHLIPVTNPSTIQLLLRCKFLLNLFLTT